MDHRYSARMVNKIEQLPDGKLRVRECSTDKGHYYATTPEPGMRCVTARDPTVDGNSIHATGTGGGRVTLTFGTSPAEYQLKTEYRNLILVATMYREKP
ncbi:MAG: hypothetical protein ACRES9_08950 [Gammaproteobacteria bacterium]